jgi:hypothetical protein
MYKTLDVVPKDAVVATLNPRTSKVEEMAKLDEYAEGALVNIRVRDSYPNVADKAKNWSAASPLVRVQRELNAYGIASEEKLKRRCEIMLRPVVLYRALSKQPSLGQIVCPDRKVNL